MRGWSSQRKPKKPAPEQGIRVARIGATWWGKRWVAALEAISSAYSARMGRGRTYARAGRVHDLTLKGSDVTAKVTGSSSRPYTVRIAVAPLGDEAWQRAIEALSVKAAFAASLLAGEMPQAIDEAFAAAGATLFPSRETDLVTSCSCPDWANPCKHVAATHYVLGDAIDRDPFVLFELRGRSRADVLERLRAARPADRERAVPRADAAPVGTKAAATTPAEHDRPRAPWPSMRLTFAPPQRPGSALAQLGEPRGWRVDRSPADRLRAVVTRAAERARALSLEAEPDE